MKIINITLLCALLSIAGCYCPMYGQQITGFKGYRVYQGQTSQSLASELGPPDMVSEGHYVKNAWAGCGMASPGRYTIEWVFVDEQNYLSLIVWIDGGIVRRIGLVPSDEIKR